MDDEITELEIVQAFAEYERRHRPGVLEPFPAEMLARKAGRLATDCETACRRAVERGLARWHAFNPAERGPTEKGRALLAAAATDQ